MAIGIEVLLEDKKFRQEYEKLVKDFSSDFADGAADAAKDAAEELKKLLPAPSVATKLFEKATKPINTILDTNFGRNMQTKLGTSFMKGVDDLAKSARLKEKAGKLAETMAAPMSKKLGVELKPQAIQQMLMQQFKQQERQPGLIEKFLYGSKGKKAVDKDMRESFAAMAFQQSMTTMFGQPGAIIGGIPANVRAMGYGKGLAATGLQAGLGLMGGALNFGREREQALSQLATVSGGTGRGALGGRGGRAAGILDTGLAMRMTEGETAQTATPLARMGNLGAFRTVGKAQIGLGMGGEMTDMFSAMAERGQAVGQQGPAARRKAQEELKKVLGAGIASGLTQGRWGEVATGMAQMIRQRGIGMTINSEGVAGMITKLGKGGVQGAEAFGAMQGIEALGRAPKTALGRAISMMTVGGLGEHGDIFKAERKAELGFFGETTSGKKGGGQPALSKTLEEYKKAFGVTGPAGQEIEGDAQAESRRGALIKELSINMGVTQNATEKLVALMETGTASDEELKKTMEKGLPLADQAYNAMIGLTPLKDIELKTNEIMNEIYKLLEPFIKDTAVPFMNKTVELLKGLIEFFGGEEEKGVGKGAAADPTSAAARRAGVSAYTSTMAGFGEDDEFMITDEKRRKAAIAEYYAATGKRPQAGEAGIAELETVVGKSAETMSALRSSKGRGAGETGVGVSKEMISEVMSAVFRSMNPANVNVSLDVTTDSPRTKVMTKKSTKAHIAAGIAQAVR